MRATTHRPSTPPAVRWVPWLLLSAALAVPVSAADLEEIRAEIEAADRSFNRAARERDQAAFKDLLDKDATFLAGELHRGRLAFLAIWQHLFDGKYDFRYEAETLEVTAARSGDLGWSLGEVRTRFTRPGLSTEEVVEAHYVNLWQRGAEGSWRLAYSAPLVVHPTLGTGRDPRSGLMTAWPELADQIGAETEIRWSPEAFIRAGSGELAYTFGEYEASFVRRDPGTAGSEGAETVAGRGHFLALWQKDAEGRWQLAAEGFTPPTIYEGG